MTKNVDVIKSFINGDVKCKTRNLTVKSDGEIIQLFNYNTVIAERVVDLGSSLFNIGGEKAGFVVNETKYSTSTSTIQNAVKRELEAYGFKYLTLDDVEMDAKSL